MYEDTRENMESNPNRQQPKVQLSLDEAMGDLGIDK
tara:strand:- start:357 stop:464 length:108 start_codon:yes stop_codon:yes gene_type:complete